MATTNAQQARTGQAQTNPNGTSPQATSQNKPFTYPYESQKKLIYLAEVHYKDGTTDIREIVVANFVPRIVAEIVTEDGERRYKIECRLETGRIFTFDISTEDFSQTNKLKAAIERAGGAKVEITAKQEIHLAPATKKFTLAPITIKQFNRTGWYGDEFLIPGRSIPDVEIDLPSSLSYSITGKGNPDKGLEALEYWLDSTTKQQATILLAYALQAPLSRLAGWENERYALGIFDRTGKYKSSNAQLAMCLYGASFQSDHMLIKWGDATPNAIMRLASHSHDLPFLIDNFKPNTGGGEKNFINLIHNILEGGEKKRLTADSNLKEARPVFCWPIITGEDAPQSDAATTARILILKWSKNDSEKLGKAQALADHLPAIGAMWLDWLKVDSIQRDIKAEVSTFSTARAKWTKELEGANSKALNTSRIATNLATNELTWYIALKHPVIGPLLQGFSTDHKAGLKAIAWNMANRTAESLEAERFLEALRQVVNIVDDTLYTQVSYSSDPLGVSLKDKMSYANEIGFMDQTGIYLKTDKALEAVYRLIGNSGLGGISKVTLYDQLDEIKMIASKDKNGKTTIVKRRGGVTDRYLHLKLEALEAI